MRREYVYPKEVFTLFHPDHRCLQVHRGPSNRTTCLPQRAQLRSCQCEEWYWENVLGLWNHSHQGRGRVGQGHGPQKPDDLAMGPIPDLIRFQPSCYCWRAKGACLNMVLIRLPPVLSLGRSAAVLSPGKDIAFLSSIDSFVSTS
jgi:hypothetical protein